MCKKLPQTISRSVSFCQFNRISIAKSFRLKLHSNFQYPHHVGNIFGNSSRNFIAANLGFRRINFGLSVSNEFFRLMPLTDESRGDLFTGCIIDHFIPIAIRVRATASDLSFIFPSDSRSALSVMKSAEERQICRCNGKLVSRCSLLKIPFAFYILHLFMRKWY